MKVNVEQTKEGAIEISHKGELLSVSEINLHADADTQRFEGSVELISFGIVNIEGEVSCEMKDPLTGDNKRVKRIEFEDGSVFEDGGVKPCEVEAVTLGGEPVELNEAKFKHGDDCPECGAKGSLQICNGRFYIKVVCGEGGCGFEGKADLES